MDCLMNSKWAECSRKEDESVPHFGSRADAVSYCNRLVNGTSVALVKCLPSVMHFVVSMVSWQISGPTIGPCKRPLFCACSTCNNHCRSLGSSGVCTCTCPMYIYNMWDPNSCTCTCRFTCTCMSCDIAWYSYMPLCHVCAWWQVHIYWFVV